MPEMMEGTTHDKYRVTIDQAPTGAYEWTLWELDPDGTTYHEGASYSACASALSPTVAGAYCDGWAYAVVLEATNAHS